MSQEHALAVKKANSFSGCIKRNTANRSREEIIPMYSTHFRPHPVLHSLHYRKDVDKLEQIQWRTTFCWGLDHHALGGEGEGTGLVHPRGEKTPLEDGGGSRISLQIATGSLHEECSQAFHSGA